MQRFTINFKYYQINDLFLDWYKDMKKAIPVQSAPVGRVGCLILIDRGGKPHN